jgi:uncharacterized protein
MTDAGPETDRVEWLDALRGLALFGILTANILYWSGWSFMSPGQQVALAGVEGAAWERFLHKLLVDGKFYTIFSLLFGLGFSLQLERLARRGADGVRVYKRRIAGLLLIGVVHMVLVWDGDILTLYALLGFTLPLFRRFSDRRLLASAVALLLLPLLGVPLFQALGWAPHEWFERLSVGISVAIGAGTMEQDLIGWLRQEGFYPYAAWVLSSWPWAFATRIEGWRIPKVLGIMLIGMMIGRRVAAGRGPVGRRALWAVLIAGGIVGGIFSYAYARMPELGQESVPAVLGTAPLGLAYASAFLLLWSHAKPLLRHLAPVGRMALTNYLSHSLLGIIIFYGIGFGLIGRLPPLGFYGVALAIFIGQTLFSRWWLARHAHGPMEGLWRRMTYGCGALTRPPEHANAA